MMQAGFELFDHTADIGIRAWGADFAALLQAAAQGLYAVIGSLKTGEGRSEWWLDLGGTDDADLLRSFLAALLLKFDCSQQVMEELVVVEKTATRLNAKVTLAPLVAERSEFAREAKAVTYHELRIRPIAGGYEATVIVDI